MSATRVDLFDSTYRHFASEVLADIRREAFGDADKEVPRRRGVPRSR